MNKLEIIIAVIITTMIGLILYKELNSDKFYIRKDEWHCTQTKLVTITYAIPSGNGVQYVPQISSVCTQYSRNGG